MKLYKEHNVNPASGCLPMLLQMPFFFMLYSVIRGITNTVSKGATLPYTYVNGVIDPNTSSKCTQKVCADPRYLSETSKMYHDIVAAHGQLISGGMDFAAKLLSHHASPWAYIPYAVLVAGAVGLQYLQMARLNARNPQANQANPQAAMLQKYMPLIFGFIYLNVAAILNVYFIVSSAIRIATQEVLFRKGIVAGPNSPGPAAKAGDSRSRSIAAAKDSGVETTEKALPKPKGGGSGSAKGSDKASTNGTAPSSNGSGPASEDTSDGTGAAKKPHPRSKAKKERKAR